MELFDFGIPALDKALNLTATVLLLLALGMLLIRVILRLCDRAFDRSERLAPFRTYLRSTLRAVLYILLALAVLGSIGVEITSFVALLSVAGLAVSLSLQNTLSNVAGGIIDRFPQDLVATDAIDPHQQGVATRNQQGQEREFRGMSLQHGGQQVPLHVVHRHGRLVPGQSQAATNRGPHQQSPDQPRAGGIGDTIDIGRGAGRLRHRRLDQRQRLANMIPARELRNHTAIIGVQLDLAIQLVREDPLLIVVDRDPGLVTGTFYT